MTMLWSERFFVEFFKENQEAWEADIPLNMGQWLSIPLFLWGVTFMIRYWGFGKKKA
ncbi:prolipoprotein diacylglyceryl transferase family protein [Reichenbachiella sp.]|uniref:prolipoprotein diacylglyceryl transferase family protein n=1 Tax=Reichenbachiella sp. TaxID=2184521 RepID=UPI003BB2127F